MPFWMPFTLDLDLQLYFGVLRVDLCAFRASRGTTMAAEDTLFTKIIRGDIPSCEVARGEGWYAFLDINPRCCHPIWSLSHLLNIVSADVTGTLSWYL